MMNDFYHKSSDGIFIWGFPGRDQFCFYMSDGLFNSVSELIDVDFAYEIIEKIQDWIDSMTYEQYLPHAESVAMRELRNEDYDELDLAYKVNEVLDRIVSDFEV